MPLARETTYDRVAHPDVLTIGKRSLLLVDEPLTRPIQDGHPTLGWEGDARFALYIDGRTKQWVLVRLEADGVYRITTETDMGAVGKGAIDVVGELIVFLVTHDQRRGFDVIRAIDSHNEARERDLDRRHSDFVLNEVAPRLKHALRRDGLDP